MPSIVTGTPASNESVAGMDVNARHGRITLLVQGYGQQLEAFNRWTRPKSNQDPKANTADHRHRGHEPHERCGGAAATPSNQRDW